ncbi:MAG: PTS sugar transporter subunit IIA [Rhodobacteraceae bacterium]|jgi:PTS system nitrogen regulatory IIA component|nr:PTS sugar transporter subunit IIA [Paracoccaceae bacterium]
MQLAEILSPEAVRVFGTMTSKKRLFQELAGIAATLTGLQASDLFDSLQERESLGPTGVGNGVALPHARVPDLDKVTGVFVRLEKPLAFDAVDRQPVDLVFALFAPEEAGVDHLKALALVSRKLRNATVCTKLRANDDPATLYAVLIEGEATQAA